MLYYYVILMSVSFEYWISFHLVQNKTSVRQGIDFMFIRDIEPESVYYVIDNQTLYIVFDKVFKSNGKIVILNDIKDKVFIPRIYLSDCCIRFEPDFLSLYYKHKIPRIFIRPSKDITKIIGRYLEKDRLPKSAEDKFLEKYSYTIGSKTPLFTDTTDIFPSLPPLTNG
nr:hypothetical protein [Abalone asfa-like virus]